MTSAPIVTTDDLGLYLGDSALNQERADLMIRLAQMECESIVSPLPAGAEVVVMRVAGRAYTSTLSSAKVQQAAAGGMFGGLAGSGGVWLSNTDRADLRRYAGGGTAFSINMLPASYAASVPPWDINGGADVATS